MGDRGNIVIRQSQYGNEGPGVCLTCRNGYTSASEHSSIQGHEPAKQPEYVWLYTHWSGSLLPVTLQEALKLKERWDDTPYLARIIFDKMTGLSGGTTGFGIGTSMGDNGHPILVVDPQKQMIEVWSEGDGGLGRKLDEWSFANYILLGDPTTTAFGSEE